MNLYSTTQQECTCSNFACRFLLTNKITLTAALFKWKLTKWSRTQILVMTHSYDTPYHVRHIFTVAQCIRRRKNGPVRLEIPEGTNLKWERWPVLTPASALIQVLLQIVAQIMGASSLQFFNKPVRIWWLRPSKYYKLTLTNSFELSKAHY